MQVLHSRAVGRPNTLFRFDSLTFGDNTEREAASYPAQNFLSDLLLSSCRISLCLSRLDANGSDWIYRLAGTHILDRFGWKNPRGTRVSDHYGPERAEGAARLYQKVVTELEPIVTQGKLASPQKSDWVMEAVHVPIDGFDRRWVFGGMFFFD